MFDSEEVGEYDAGGKYWVMVGVRITFHKTFFHDFT